MFGFKRLKKQLLKLHEKVALLENPPKFKYGDNVIVNTEPVEVYVGTMPVTIRKIKGKVVKVKVHPRVGEKNGNITAYTREYVTIDIGDHIVTYLSESVKLQ